VQTYLLHYSTPYPRGRHPQHYLGWAVSVQDRLTDHQRGSWAAAALTRAMAAEGITFDLVRTWDGGPAQEKRLKFGGATPWNSETRSYWSSTMAKPLAGSWTSLTIW
jgi:hypothetical protein